MPGAAGGPAVVLRRPGRGVGRAAGGPARDRRARPAALDRLLELGGEEALYVPGHGAAADAAFVRAQREALERFAVA
ncbi:MBL fold metallo-hydrolase [Streptomyces californicus]